MMIVGDSAMEARYLKEQLEDMLGNGVEIFLDFDNLRPGGRRPLGPRPLGPVVGTLGHHPLGAAEPSRMMKEEALEA